MKTLRFAKGRSQGARSLRCPGKARRGFTLAEAAITIAIVGMTITYTLQALTSAQTTAAHTHELKLAREMALRTLGEISTGQYQAEMNDVITGNYPEDVAPYMSYQIAFGDATLPRHGDFDEERDPNQIDNWANRREWEQDRGMEDDEEGTEQEYETVRIRVIFPKHSENLDDSIEFEAWIPWEQVYGVPEEEEGAEPTNEPDPGAGEGDSGSGGTPDAGGPSDAR